MVCSLGDDLRRGHVGDAREWRGGSHRRTHPGPRHDWLSPVGRRTLAGSLYRVEPTSNRVGLRLGGPQVELCSEDELPSEGIVLGSVEIPPDGQPVLFLADHPTTAGYPVVGVGHLD